MPFAFWVRCRSLRILQALSGLGGLVLYIDPGTHSPGPPFFCFQTTQSLLEPRLCLNLQGEPVLTPGYFEAGCLWVCCEIPMCLVG